MTRDEAVKAWLAVDKRHRALFVAHLRQFTGKLEEQFKLYLEAESTSLLLGEALAMYIAAADLLESITTEASDG